MSYLSIPRHYIFVLQDGTRVIRLSEDRVWNLNTDEQQAYHVPDFGRAITDGDLRELQEADFVGEFAADEVSVRADIATAVESDGSEAHRIRAYYLSTRIRHEQFDLVQQTLANLVTSHVVVPDVHDEFVVLYGREGRPFTTVNDAENVLQELINSAPGFFSTATVSVYEVAHTDTAQHDSPLKASLRTQTAERVKTDKAATRGKTAVVVGGGASIDQKLIRSVLTDELEMKVYICQSSREAIPIIEDYRPDVLLVDLQLSDTHGWPFIRKLRELPASHSLKILVMSSDQTDMVIALKVVRVNGFVLRPLQRERLREQVWVTLNTL
ncbi:MAG: response regulator [Chloroflexota bacterium]